MEDKIIDIDLSATSKKKIRINGDNNKILEINTSDLGLLGRLEETYPKLNKLSQEASLALSETNEEDTQKIAEILANINTEMCKYLDYIFDSNVSELCSDGGTMYDLFNGKFRFEHIIEVLGEQYETNLKSEIHKAQQRLKKHTSKYTKKKR